MVAGQGWEKKHVFFVLFVCFPQQKKDAFFNPNPVAGEAKLPKKKRPSVTKPSENCKKKNFVLEGFKPPNKDLEVCTKKILRCLADGQEVPPGHQETFASRRDPSPLPFPAFKEEFSTDCRGHRGVRRQCPPRNARRLLGLG